MPGLEVEAGVKNAILPWSMSFGQFSTGVVRWHDSMQVCRSVETVE